MSKPSQAPVEPPPSSLPPHVQKAVDSNQPAPERFETVPVASFKSIRASGKNEAWLQQQIFDDPSILGLGDLQGIRRERAQTSGGRLDMLLVNPSNDDMFEVEIMLGECDESHIIRTIEYWDSEKRRWPQRKHTAVLVAERINGRFWRCNKVSVN